jgi:isoquinoline 1-oxidoreductase alpha subunit
LSTHAGSRRRFTRRNALAPPANGRVFQRKLFLFHAGKSPQSASRTAQYKFQSRKTMIRFTVNGERIETNVAESTPLLWFLRDNLEMTGTKYGCGIAQCGACTVHINGDPARACTTPLSAVAGKRITTIESIGSSALGKKVQAAWLSEDVVQCGYCQSGQIMSATALLAKNSNPSDAQIDDAMSGNICRCGTYNRVRAAIKVAAAAPAKAPPSAKPAAKAKA